MKRFLSIFLCLVMLTSSFALALAQDENELPQEPWEGQSYVITFVEADGTEVPVTTREGELPVYPNGTPAKADDNDYTYEFAGWEPVLAVATANATYTAKFNAIPKTESFTVTFVNEDGTELQKVTVVKGETPEYTGETPAKEATAQYTYTFAGWTPEVAAADADATYTATYTAAVNKYTVQFVNGEEVLQSEEFYYGVLPSYKGETPTMTDDEQFTYTFAGWTPAIVEVTGEATYTASFIATPKPVEPTGFTVTFVDEDGTVLKKETVVAGGYATAPDAPTKAPVDGNPIKYYGFKGWDTNFTNVTGDLVVKATYFLCGDIDGQDGVTTSDITVLRRYLAGGYEISFVEEALDVDGQDGVTTSDITILRRYLAGGYNIELN